jgi:hypothetical protein
MPSGATLKNTRQSGTDMAIFSLIAKLGLDGSSFEGGLKRATSMTDKFRSSVGAQLGGALSVAAIGAFASKVIETADAIGDLSEQLNISTDDVQRLQVLAGQTGISFEAMAKSITAVSQERLKAIEEGGKAREYFRALGLDVSELNKNSVSNIEIIRRMAESHENAGKSAQTQAALIGILGEKAFKAAGAISKLSEQGEIKLINKEEIDAIGRLADRIDELKRQATVAAAPEVSFLETYTENLTSLLDIMNRGGGLPEYLRNIQAAAIPALYMNAEADKKFEALPLVNQGRLGTVDARVKKEISMFTEPAAPGWVNTMVGQIKIMTNETRAVRVNTGRTAQAVQE